MIKNYFCIRKSKRMLFWVLPTFLLSGNQVFAKSNFLEGKPTSSQQAKQETVTGKVTDSSTGGFIVGATIQVKDSDVSTQTDVLGAFTIQAKTGDVLVVNYIGYTTREIPVTASTVDISLVSSQEAIDEVVVMGYGSQRRSEVTSAVASVKEKDFNQGGMRSPMDLIQGKVAGLNVTRTQGSNPNSGTSIQLRGMASLSGGNSPLIVIDGIPGGSLDLIKQGDIESFDVLKDGSAAAIYGTRGNGGVILITTKKGKAGVSQFDYQTYGQREFVDRRPTMLSADQFRSYVVEGQNKPDLDLGASTDLYDELINKDNFSHFHNFSASGGGENSTYRASINYEDAQGIAKQNGREQFGGRLNFTQTGLQDRLTFATNIAANFNKANLLGGKTEYFEQAIQRNPTAAIYNPDGTFLETQGYNNFNPLARLENRIEERDQSTFSGDARLKLQIIEPLSISAFGSYLRNQYNDRQYRSINDWDQRPNSDYQGMAYAYKGNHLTWSQTFETTIDYNKTFNEKHNLTGLLGYSYQYNALESFDMSNNGFTNDAFLDWNMGAGTALTNDQLPRPGMNSFKEDNKLIAFFGRVNYNYDDRYFISAIMRREGSTRFGTNNKWGNFPAISAGWTITNEEFFTNKNIVNNLRLRAGYGVTGNQGVNNGEDGFSNYQSLILLGTGGVYPQNGVYYQTYGPSTNPNPDLKWEQKAETNLGVDFGLFNNRLTGALDFYIRKTTDILYNYVAQQPAYVASNIWFNVGEVDNRGVELQLSGIPIRKEHFQWNVDFTGNYQKNKLVTMSNDRFRSDFLEFGGLPSPGNLGNAIRLEEGGEVGSFYGKRFAGFDDEGKWLFFKADGSTAYAGEINENDLTYIGNGVPKFQASLSNRFSYKGFDLTVFLRGKFKYDILNTADMFFGNQKWLPNNVFESAFTSNAGINDDPQFSDYYLENGSFVKLDNITLGYNFNLKTNYVRNMYVFLTARNIATFTSYSGLDPELQDTGFDSGIDGRGFYPRTQSWSVGLNIGF
ncbi:SusC/RagA family TonB-linked outer membrane protein [Sphingobacterium hungaricum]|uniref:SusC/RagA family TonB-linked outer membrane protein n=1 Tax=Sphingobacterium hungaricum TaxID=2082723 RepID=A0A928UUW1_9SPHI|nr:SusC/RagA family TonB-linked outer membrane protein [Sphingobacterium hungaricum]MBE8713776.1 SusC/RagA family TonB-linked outer membrane protein [Sphingobacterium hungaricum]